MRKEKIENFCYPYTPGGGVVDLVDNAFPKTLAANEFRSAVKAIVDAALSERTIILAIGGHVIKTGLSPLIIDAMGQSIISHVAMNGAAMIHDVEFAMFGTSSEEVHWALENQTFANDEQARSLCLFINNAIKGGRLGLGHEIGFALRGFKYQTYSILHKAHHFFKVPVTVHATIGTDIHNIYYNFDSEQYGKLLGYDFDIFCKAVRNLEGGVYINLGSAVMMPEIFLKAVAKEKPKNFTTIAMDFKDHYRVRKNVVERHGNGIYLIGHNEIMFPLLMAAVYEEIERQEEK